MKIAVLMGGHSGEREVSLDSGNAIADACTALGHDVKRVEIDGNLESIIPDIKSVDLVFNGLHGTGGEDGAIQGFLKSLNLPFTGSGVESSAICMDKRVSKSLAENKGIKTPAWITLEKNEDPPKAISMSYPVVVKPSREGSSIGLSIVQDSGGLKDAVALAKQHTGVVLIEEYIKGKEITVSVIGSEAYPIVEIIPSHEFYDYQCKYTKGMSEYRCPAEIPEEQTKEIQDIALRIHSMMGCRHYSRVDFRMDEKETAYFLEINTLPGMTETSLLPKSAKAKGISFNQLIEKLISLAIQKVS